MPVIDERAVILRRMRDPRTLARSLPFYLNALGAVARRRMFGDRRRPPYLPPPLPLPPLPPDRAVPAQAVRLGAGGIAPREIRLASGNWPLHDPVPWLASFDDEEDMLALHRWGWLLVLFVEHPWPHLSAWGRNVMLDWWREMRSRRAHPAWETYSASERLANAVLFLAATAQEVGNLAPVLTANAEHVASTLEYYGDDRTGNHLFNNGRALYLAGALLNVPPLRELGRTLVRHEAERIFTASGFLREGSSHYHFLLTRSLLEVLWAAQVAGDASMVEVLRPTAARAIRRCTLFLVCDPAAGVWRIPLIGDISPDVTPEWLLGLPWSAPAQAVVPGALPAGGRLPRGWADLWGPARSEAPDAASPPQPPRVAEFPDSGWLRADVGPWTAFWHAHPGGTLPAHGTHAHNDHGAPVVFFRGLPVLVDAGRGSYRGTPLGDYGMCARAHNTILVDGLEPFVLFSRHRVPPWYRQSDVELTASERDGAAIVEFRHDGFSRTGRRIVVRRRWQCARAGLSAEDVVEGEGEAGLETLFHWDTAATLEQEDASTWRVVIADQTLRFRITADLPIEIRQDRGIAGPQPSGWIFPQYGVAEPSTTFAVVRRGRLPARMAYWLEPI